MPKDDLTTGFTGTPNDEPTGVRKGRRTPWTLCDARPVRSLPALLNIRIPPLVSPWRLAPSASALATSSDEIRLILDRAIGVEPRHRGKSQPRANETARLWHECGGRARHALFDSAKQDRATALRSREFSFV